MFLYIVYFAEQNSKLKTIELVTIILSKCNIYYLRRIYFKDVAKTVQK